MVGAHELGLRFQTERGAIPRDNDAGIETINIPDRDVRAPCLAHVGSVDVCTSGHAIEIGEERAR